MNQLSTKRRVQIVSALVEGNSMRATCRMSIRRFTRLTNAFSKKVENHAAAVALHFMHYNFYRIHRTIRVTPAMEAGVTDHLWSLEDMVKLLDTTGPSTSQDLE